MNVLRECGIYTNGVLFSHKEEIMLFAGKCMELENFMLSDVIQAQKSQRFHVFSHDVEN
jgi:hypothetical protein